MCFAKCSFRSPGSGTGKAIEAALDGISGGFSDLPGNTSLGQHHIQVVDGVKPVQQVPYRLHPEKLRAVTTEIS